MKKDKDRACVVCLTRKDLAGKRVDLGVTSGIAMAVAFQQKGMLSREMMPRALCKRHRQWFEQELRTMMENFPGDA
jgi:hypothetical protein